MKPAINYLKYFKDRTLIITGVGRSGTTILGKLIGSMEPAYYLFEPAILKYGIGMALPEFSGIIIEDYFLPMVQGRNLNFNEKEDSCIYNYKGRTFPEQVWRNLGNKNQSLQYIQKFKPFWIIKTNEIAQFTIIAYEVYFPGVRFLHIIRNGNDVIGSSLARGWYTDNYMKNEIVDFVKKKLGYNCPWYLSKEDQENWKDWNQVTRCACVWRTLVETIPPAVSYENLLESPRLWTEKFAKEFNLGITPTTERHLKEIKSPKKYPNFLDSIEEPERSKYLQTMKKFGYA